MPGAQVRVVLNDTISRADLTRLLDYDPETGILLWRERYGQVVFNGRWAGRAAGSINGDGHRQVEIENTAYMAHRIIWMISYGRWPEEQIDHWDGDPDNNCLGNLREATQFQNQQNRKDKSEHVGASWHKKKRRWQSRISANGRMRTLGYFDTAEAAHQRYVQEKALVHYNPTLRAA